MGVELVEVEPGGPAAQAGMRPGDLLVALDGEPLTGMAALQGALAPERIDREVTVEIVRGDRRLLIAARLGEWPAR